MTCDPSSSMDIDSSWIPSVCDSGIMLFLYRSINSTYNNCQSGKVEIETHCLGKFTLRKDNYLDLSPCRDSKWANSLLIFIAISVLKDSPCQSLTPHVLNKTFHWLNAFIALFPSYRLFGYGVKCFSCLRSISDEDLVMRAKDMVCDQVSFFQLLLFPPGNVCRPWPLSELASWLSHWDISENFAHTRNTCIRAWLPSNKKIASCLGDHPACCYDPLV